MLPPSVFNFMSSLFIILPVRQKINQKYKAINKVKDVVCFLLSCRKYFCKYVESIKYLLDSASFDDSDKTIMYRGICVDKMWLCNLCTFATRPIKVLFSYFKIPSSCGLSLVALCSHCSPWRFVVMKCRWSLISVHGRWITCSLNTQAGLDRWQAARENICSDSRSKGRAEGMMERCDRLVCAVLSPQRAWPTYCLIVIPHSG